MPESQSKSLKIFFHAIDGIGHLNACVGIAQALASRGHRIYFLLNDAFAGQFSKFEFNEILLKSSPQVDPSKSQGEVDPDAPPVNPIKQMAEVLIKIGLLGPQTPLEKVKEQMANEDNSFMEQLLNAAIEYNPQIEAAIERERPDVFILDNFLVPPAVQKASLPWLYLYSPNPMSLYKSDVLPPYGAGYPTASDPSTWREFRALWKEYAETKWGHFQVTLDKACNYEPLVQVLDKEKMTLVSPWLTIYGFPQELDYHDLVARPEKIIGVDAFSRVVPEPFEVPEALNVQSGDKLIYVSLGSMGSIDVDLMKRITSVLAKTPYKYIVSKGQRGDEYELPSNCWGENFLPQTKILPLVDLVITHGGNNTITETFSFGKPMIVMPLFADQFDNAQRVDEKGFGRRIEPYTFKEEQLVHSMKELLNNHELKHKLKVAAERIDLSNSKEVLCKRIEAIVQKYAQEHQNRG